MSNSRFLLAALCLASACARKGQWSLNGTTKALRAQKRARRVKAALNATHCRCSCKLGVQHLKGFDVRLPQINVGFRQYNVR